MATAIQDAKDAVAAAATPVDETTPADIAAAGEKAIADLEAEYAKAIDAAYEEALNDLMNAYQAALALDQKYTNSSLNSGIQYAYNAAVQAVEAAYKADPNTIKGITDAAAAGVAAIDEVVEDVKNVDEAVEYLKENGVTGPNSDNTAIILKAVNDALTAAEIDVTASDYQYVSDVEAGVKVNATVDLKSGDFTYNDYAFIYTIEA